MLKLNMWLNHIPISQIFFSNLNIEENNFFLSRASIHSQWVSEDQPGTILFGIDFFFLKKISLWIWTKPGSWSTLWSFPFLDLLLLLLFFSWLWSNQGLKTSKQRGCPNSFGHGKWRMPKAWALDLQGRREERRKRGGVGCSMEAWGC